MHELSIALSIIETATEEAEERGYREVSTVHLRLGPLSGVVKEALLFAYNLSCEGTPLEGSRLLIEEIPVVIRCSPCQAEHAVPPSHLCCPVCNTPSMDVVRGRELEVFAMEINE